MMNASDLARHAAQKLLDGEPTGSLGEEAWARMQAEKVVDLAAARARLRPSAEPAHI